MTPQDIAPPEITQADIRRAEAEAHRLRAEAFRAALRALFTWKPAPKPAANRAPAPARSGTGFQPA